MKTALYDIYKRLTKFDKKINIISNGYDNSYPERVERTINNSVTAKSSANILATFLGGKGFGDEFNSFIVNKKKGVKLQSFLNSLTRCFAKQNGAFIHVNYNANYKIVSLDLLPFTHCRLGKKDDNQYNGKILVYPDWIKEEGKVKTDDIRAFDVFNPDPKVIDSQVEKAGGWKNYKGQILYINFDEEFDYPLSKIDPVLNDCDSESQASIYKNKSLRKGFFGKTLVITKPLAGGLEDYDTPADYHNAVSQQKDFKNTIESFVGAENNGSILHVELEKAGDSFDEAIKFENIGSNIDDKVFEYTESSVFKNILMAFNNIPGGLIRSDNALFGNSGEALKEMRRSYQDNTTQEREFIEESLKSLLTNFLDYTGPTKILPLIDNTEVKNDPISN